MDSSGVSGAGGSNTPTNPSLPKQIPTGLGKSYPASKAPGIKKWFHQMFPSLSGKDLDQAVSQFMQIQAQSMNTLMQRLNKQQQKALEELRKSEK